MRSVAFSAALVSFTLLAASASADLYKWNDERGNLVISNERPADMRKVRNFEVALKEPQEKPQQRGAPTRNEQALLERIDNLERELRAQQSSSQRVWSTPPLSYSGPYDYAPPPPPPPSAGYYSNYYPGYYYPAPAYSYVAYPRSTFVAGPSIAFSRGFPSRGGFAHRARR